MNSEPGSDPLPSLDPIELTVDPFHCGWDGPAVMGPIFGMRLDFDLGPDSVSLVDGQQGILNTGGADVYAIEVAEATIGHCCHFNEYYRLLVQRVHP